MRSSIPRCSWAAWGRSASCIPMRASYSPASTRSTAAWSLSSRSALWPLRCCIASCIISISKPRQAKMRTAIHERSGPKSASMKSTVEQIRQRFDHDVERFSNLETGQSATIDAPLVLDLITTVAAATNPNATHVLDIGCGAGNYTLKLLQRLPNLDVTLIDLSQPMLARAQQRIGAISQGSITTLQGDIRDVTLKSEAFDIIMAAAVFHHLREDAEWEAVFHKCYE